MNLHIKGNPFNDKKYWANVLFRFKSGDRLAFEEIYSEYVDTLFAYGSKITNNKELIQDSIQDLFIDMYKYKINLEKPETNTIKVNSQSVEITSFEGSGRLNIDSLEEIELHKLLSGNPYLISGEVAQAIMEAKHGGSSAFIEINFNDTEVKYVSDAFEVIGDVKISYFSRGR